MFAWHEQYLTCSLLSLVGYCSCQSEQPSEIQIFSPPCNFLHIYHFSKTLRLGNLYKIYKAFLFPLKGVSF